MYRSPTNENQDFLIPFVVFRAAPPRRQEKQEAKKYAYNNYQQATECPSIFEKTTPVQSRKGKTWNGNAYLTKAKGRPKY